MTLDKLKTDEIGVILKISGDTALKLRLLDMGFVSGTEIKMLKTAPFGDPLEFLIRGYRIALRKKDTAKIEIERIK